MKSEGSCVFVTDTVIITVNENYLLKNKQNYLNGC